MRPSSRAGFAFLILLSLQACTSPDPQTPTIVFEPMESPAGPGSETPYLATDDDGTVHLTWLERTGDSTHALRYASQSNSVWSVPATVIERNDLFVNWADFPSVLVTPSGRILVHWLQRTGGGPANYDSWFRQSTDEGRTWSAPSVLNTDGVAAEHGFVSLVATTGDSVEAVWLDGRSASGHGGGGHGAMQLANSRIAADGGTSVNTMIDTRTCDCCQTAAASTSRGTIVVYRDRSAAEIRDIAVLRRVEGRWTDPEILYADNWHIEGCPVNGPAIDATGDRVVVAWFTGARDTARVNVAFSNDAGASFTAPVRVDEGLPVGRVDVVLDENGRALVSWLEQTGTEEASVMLRAVTPDGGISPVVPVAASTSARRSGFPRIARVGDAIIVAWTDAGDSTHVRLAKGRLTSPE